MGGRLIGGEEGPEALFKALGIPEDKRNLTSVHILDQYKRKSKEQIEAVKKIKNELTLLISTAFDQDKTPVIIGGDHSLSISTFAIYLSRFKEKFKEIGIIYIDAHPDFHTTYTSETQNIHGMSVAASCIMDSGYTDEMRGEFTPKASTSSICLLGIRNPDKAEVEAISKFKVFNRTSLDILKTGSPKCTREAVVHLKAQGIEKVIVSFDIDVLDPSYAPASGLAEPNGISLGDVLGIFEVINREFEVLAYEFVEFAPIRDTKEKITEKHYVEIIEKALSA